LPRVIPVPEVLPTDLLGAADTPITMIQKLSDDVTEARNNLLLTKITQSHNSDAHRAPDPTYKVGDLVMLSTNHRRHEYKKKGEQRATKFFSRWDGPFRITCSHPETSSYTLYIPNNAYPVFHTTKLKTHLANDPTLFPICEIAKPGPVLTADSLEEHIINEIIDSSRCGQGLQFLVRWLGYPPEHNEWLPSTDVKDCEALNVWYQIGGNGPDMW
jgi:hypothetical protein